MVVMSEDISFSRKDYMNILTQTEPKADSGIVCTLHEDDKTSFLRTVVDVGDSYNQTPVES